MWIFHVLIADYVATCQYLLCVFITVQHRVEYSRIRAFLLCICAQLLQMAASLCTVVRQNEYQYLTRSSATA